MLTIEQLMKELGVSRSTVFRWMRKGMPYGFSGLQRKIFDLDSVHNWLTKQHEQMKIADEVKRQVSK